MTFKLRGAIAITLFLLTGPTFRQIHFMTPAAKLPAYVSIPINGVFIGSSLYLLYALFITYKYFRLPKATLEIEGVTFKFRLYRRLDFINMQLVTTYSAVHSLEDVGDDTWSIDLDAVIGPNNGKPGERPTDEFLYYQPSPRETPVPARLMFKEHDVSLTFYRLSDRCDCPLADRCQVAIYSCKQPFVIGHDLMVIDSTILRGTPGGGHRKESAPFIPSMQRAPEYTI